MTDIGIDETQVALPAICVELKMQASDGVPVVNSRDIAELYGKIHKHVLRDIDVILHSPNLGHGWFQRIETEHPTISGRLDRSYDMTRDGFTLLLMGWTGQRAMQFKIRYINAFNAMHAALEAASPSIANRVLNEVREAVHPLEAHIRKLTNDIEQITLKLENRRRQLSTSTRMEHIDAIDMLGGRCPCCGTAEIVIDGEKSLFTEFDHFYASSRPGIDHTWLICKPCHRELTSGRVSRDSRETVFKAYQDMRRRLPGRQTVLFSSTTLH